MRLLLALACAAVALTRPVSATFADQRGLDDRATRRVAPLRTVSATGKNFVVATDAGAIAAANQRTGDIVWRSVLPDGALLWNTDEFKKKNDLSRPPPEFPPSDSHPVALPSVAQVRIFSRRRHLVPTRFPFLVYRVAPSCGNGPSKMVDCCGKSC